MALASNMELGNDAHLPRHVAGIQSPCQACNEQTKLQLMFWCVWAGIYPGTSNVMAAHMISIARREYGADWSYAPSNGASTKSNGVQDQGASSGSASSSAPAASEAAEPEPLRSGVATMEPNEGEHLPLRISNSASTEAIMCQGRQPLRSSNGLVLPPWSLLRVRSGLSACTAAMCGCLKGD